MIPPLACITRFAVYSVHLEPINSSRCSRHILIWLENCHGKKLTAHSTDEQASAGLDALTDDERARFTELNTTYQDRFGFPFIIAVKGLNKADILSAFERRIAHDRDTEFTEACRQVERIALIRVKALI